MLVKTRNKLNLILKRSYDFYIAYGLMAFVVVMLVALVFGLVIRSKRIDAQKVSVDKSAMLASQSFKDIVSAEVQNLNMLSLWFVQIGNPELNFRMERSQASTILQENIASSADMRTLYMVWEPNIFDGKDSEYAETEFHDSTGRFVPVFTKRVDGTIDHDYVANYNDNADVNSYYYFKTKKNVQILEPALKRENSKNLMVLPIVYPLHFGTRLLGVIGAEYVINNINHRLASIERPADCQLMIFTPGGKVLVAPDKQLLIGRDLSAVFPDNTDFYYIKFRRGEEIEQFSDDEYIITKTCNFQDIDTHFSVCLIVDKAAMNHSGNVALAVSLLIGFLLYLLLVGLIILFRNFYSKQVKTLTEKGSELANVEKEYLIQGKLYVPELRRLDEVLLKYHKTFVKIKDLNRQIESTKYDEELDTLPSDNLFQMSYNGMLATLRQITIQENERKDKETAQHWIAEGVAAVNEAMRIGSNKVDVLSENILMTLVRYTNAVLGGLYMMSKEEDGDYLVLNAAVSLNQKKAVKIKIEKGVGIVGTCALEKQPIFLEKLPEDYIKVFSGLGKSKPRVLAVLPMLYDGDLIAVVEIAFINQLTGPQKEFLATISSVIASSLVTARINEQTEHLMKQFRAQADALASNEKEMTNNINKLKDEQQKSLEREVEMNGLLDAINNSMLSVEFSTSGTFLTANDRYLKTMHMELAEVQGMSIFDLVRDSRQEIESIMSQVLSGKYYEGEMKRISKNGDVKWFWSTYTPYYNFDGKISKILYFAIDITSNKKVQEDLQQKIVALEGRLQKMQAELASLLNEKKD